MSSLANKKLDREERQLNLIVYNVQETAEEDDNGVKESICVTSG